MSRLLRWFALAVILALTGFLLKYCVFWSPRDIGYLFEEKVLVVAHQGASIVAPENTLASFRKALDMSADALELDVMLSKDGEVVVIHDTLVDHTTDGSGNVSDLTLAELKELDAGSWFAPEFSEERVPTLQEVMSLARGRALLEIEIKTRAFLPGSLERKVLDLIVENGIEKEVIVTSFNPLSVLRAPSQFKYRDSAYL